MTKHILDQEVEDILQHYGVKGMKWDVRRTPEQIKLDAANAAASAAETLENAGDEIMGNDSIMEELGDVLNIVFGGKGNIEKEVYEVLDATKDKLEDVSKDVKKRGKVMMERIFGKSKSVHTVSTANGKTVTTTSSKGVKTTKRTGSHKNKVDKLLDKDNRKKSKKMPKFTFTR